MSFGPSPVLQASQVAEYSNNRKLILSSLRNDAAGYVDASVTWYDVTLAGFNFVDDQCTLYFNHLFKLRRNSKAAKSGLTAFGATTNAILAVTGSSTLSMTAVAQAFGLASQLVDIHSDTFLYNLPPSETSQFVREMQRAYRDGVALQSGAITGPTVTYHKIQEYLNLCLPQTIEARLVKHVSDAKAVPVGNASGTAVDVVVGNPMTLEQKARLAVINNANVTLPIIIEPPKTQGSGNKFEEQLSRNKIGRIQKALCVVPVDFKWGPATRAAVVEFYNGVGQPRPHIAQTGITARDMPKLEKALLASPVCNAVGKHKSAFQLGQLYS
ncbi:MAG: hypothetical protein GY742_19210 [Hyphomicrobiales bacterium]|nr:hypothetical protein [Hyphomicrobiales bacterium]